MRQNVATETLVSLVGTEIGVSDWMSVDQARIDAFATVTEDPQFIHVDPARAKKETPFGGTVAHGFLTLSLLTRLARDIAPVIEGCTMGINYGFDRIRFVEPVPSGERIRGRFRLVEASEKSSGRWMMRYGITVEIENHVKPALVADWLTMQFVTPSGE